MNAPRTETSSTLQRWHEGDRESLDILIEKHLPWIRERIHHRLGAKLRYMMETGDIVQDAVLQFLKYAPKILTHDERCLRSLLLKIAENVIRDQNDWFTAKRRDMARQQPLPTDTVLNMDCGEGSCETPSRLASQNEREGWIRLGIELLDTEERLVVVLREWDDLSFPEIGERVGLTKDAARMRYNRAVTRLGDIVGALRHGEWQRIVA